MKSILIEVKFPWKVEQLTPSITLNTLRHFPSFLWSRGPENVEMWNLSPG